MSADSDRLARLARDARANGNVDLFLLRMTALIERLEAGRTGPEPPLTLAELDREPGAG